MIAVKEEVHTTKSKEVDLDTLKALLVGDLVEDIGDLEGVEINLEYRDDWSRQDESVSFALKDLRKVRVSFSTKVTRHFSL